MRQILNDETSEVLERLASKLRAINHWINEWSGSNSRFCIPAEETQRDPSSATTSFAALPMERLNVRPPRLHFEEKSVLGTMEMGHLLLATELGLLRNYSGSL